MKVYGDESRLPMGSKVCVCVCVYYTVLDMVMKTVRHCGCLAPYANRERGIMRDSSLCQKAVRSYSAWNETMENCFMHRLNKFTPDTFTVPTSVPILHYIPMKV
ncbi:unnamed protein product [Arctogadus glacialis]